VVVQDNAPTASVLLTVNVTDGDEPNTPNSQVTLRLENTFGGLFMIASRDITLQGSLAGPEREYNIQIIAEDMGTPQLTTSAMFTIEVVNANENSPVITGLDTIEFTENENESILFTVIDGDDGLEGMIRLPTISGESAAFFTITPQTDPNQFMLETVTPLDREEDEIVILTLNASDNGNPLFRQTTSINIMVTVLDVNDNPPVIENLTPGMILSVLENTEMGHVVYQVNASDSDDGANAEISFVIESTDMLADFPFTINNQGQITTTRLIDDPVGVFSVNVTVTDDGSPMLSDSAVVGIAITETNNNRPVFSNLASSVVIDETDPVGNIVVQDFVVTDSDSGDAGVFRVELQQTGSVFRLDGRSVRLNQAVDYEVCAL